MPTHSQIINASLDCASKELEYAEEIVLHNTTRKLHKKYKGKKVKCVCFDTWTDGDDYSFE